MKLSKSLLQAILVGTTLGTIASCDLVETIKETDLKKANPICGALGENETEKANIFENCPGCGGG
jgi:hypothetical protein